MSETSQRKWVFSNGTIATEYTKGALVGRLHLNSTSGDTVLVPAVELLQFLSDHDIERQLAEVIAERDALKRALEESIVARDALRRQSDDAERENEKLHAECLALRRRVAELEQEAAGDWDRDDSHLPREQR
jgi:hypothetical protein